MRTSSRAHIGAFASGQVELARRDGVGVPATALERDGDEARLDVVRDGKVEVRQVKAGVIDGAWVEIQAGARRWREAWWRAPPRSCGQAIGCVLRAETTAANG